MTVDLTLEDPAKLSTPALEQMLRAKYPRDRYALFFDVPDAVGTAARRRIDAVAVGCWGSVGRKIEGFELKISRSDWLRELKQVDKADPFIQRCDYFWLVTADASIAKLDEVPACWGWMAATKNGFRIQRPATKLPGAGDTVDRWFMIGILRKLQDDMMLNPDVQALIAEKTGSFEKKLSDQVQYETRTMERRLKEMETRLTEFEEASGIKINEWRIGNVGKVVRDLQKVGYFDPTGFLRVEKTLEHQANTLRSTLDELERARDALRQHHERPAEPCSNQTQAPS